jgi:hypothetical protein
MTSRKMDHLRLDVALENGYEIEGPDIEAKTSSRAI